jgi:hypothetical protein
MGLIGYGLWVNLIQRAEPHRAREIDVQRDPRGVALQVEF